MMPRHGRGWAMGRAQGQEDRHSPVIGSLLEPALLILVKGAPSHGYSLLSDLGKMGFSTIHPSVIYRTLRGMEDLGWIQSDWVTDQTQGPPRRTYHLTEKGEEALQFWKQELSRTNAIILQLLAKEESD
ncbi:PadR family transcriptional regulator [Flexilinea flocculi]|uniref:DNA-binding transcriptional regulator, PadR family n=1 Tax=Flexilinea flocculi TaxID=1678840 RepID=A0A0K8P9W5_9CHLR|nr:PadR family transcriptional regulator [Flexilinea flocculi]GAP39431.1 DNA-binding transcriptional regulator, PadR family [Flexilinea flocculi]